MNPHLELKVAIMTKRSQNRKFFTRDNYKHRVFVLTPCFLKYYELMGETRGKEKGKIRLPLIRMVEYVTDGELDHKANVFQICYVEEIRGQPLDMSNKVLLYIVASSSEERDDWITGIRMFSHERGARFQNLFHPGIWRKPGRYSCCDDINRRSNGCQRTTPYYQEQAGGGGGGGGGVTLPSVLPNLLLPRGQTNGESNPAPGPLGAVSNTQIRPLGSASIASTGTATTSITTTATAATNTTPVISAVTTVTTGSSPQKASGTPTQGKRAASGQRRTSNRKASVDPAAPANLAPGVSEVEENTVIAVYNYNPVRENQLQLQKGEKYFVVNSDNPQWWYVRSLNGMVGYVPTNYIQKPNSLTTFDWYYRDITRQQAESILMEENREGCFLVRDSVTRKRTYTLSVTAKDPHKPGCMKVHHYHIHYSEEKGAYYLSEKHQFRTVHEVIHYHKHNSGGLVVRLRTPPTQDKECPVTAGMGLDMFELHPSELKLDKDVIGRGQFGVVLHGTYCGMHVAVKQMLPGAMNEDDFVEEAKNMKNLNHPNVVQLFGVVLRSRPIMIILEFMKHGSLRDYLRARQSSYTSRPTVLADACAQVGNGMAYLEAAKFIHRDLAARNCLVKSVSRRCLQVKVGDFGMTRFLLDNVYEPSAGAKFPVRWAAPEVFQSTYTVKADVWSFGVLMWEVFTLCSENPYHGMNNTQVYQYIVGGGRLAKPAICPERLYILMLECWHYDPAKRPNFQYISQKLEEYLDAHCDN